MSKKAKILIFLTLVFLVLIIYLILTSASFKKSDNQPIGQAGQPVKSSVLSEAESRARLKEIFTAYEKAIEENNLTIEKIAELKNELFALKGLPASFEKLPLNLVLALNKMEDYLRQKDGQGKSVSQRLIIQLKADYGWLKD